jgi:hypothetical protein
MAVKGVLPPEDPVYVRVDPAVDVVYENPRDGWEVFEGLRYARWPYGWYAQFEGPPPHTTVSVKNGTKTVARAYCRNTKLRNGNPGGEGLDSSENGGSSGVSSGRSVSSQTRRRQPRTGVRRSGTARQREKSRGSSGRFRR